MKSGQPWYKRWPHLFLDGVEGLGPELIGAYAYLLDLIYARDGRSERNDQSLAGRLGCSTRKAKALTDRLIELEKLDFQDGYLSNKKAEEVLKESRTKSERNASAGRAGGEKSARVRKNKNLADANASKQNQPDKIREEKNSSEAKASGKNADLFGEVQKPKEPSAFDIAVAWLTEAGVQRPEKHRALIGKWLKALDGNHDKLKAAIYSAKTKNIVDPVSYIAGAIRNQTGGAPVQPLPELPYDQLEPDVKARYDQGSQICINSVFYQKGFDPFVRSEAA